MMKSNYADPGADAQTGKVAEATDDLLVWINSAEVRRLCGGVSNMTIHRWLSAPALNFPRPARVNGKRFWVRGDVLAWRTRQFAEAS